MSLKDMVGKFFAPKKYKILKFGAIGNKEEIYLVLHKKGIFGDYVYLLQNDILDIVEATLRSNDNFSAISYINRNTNQISKNPPFTTYYRGIENFSRCDLELDRLLKYCFSSIEKCEEMIENHKKIIEFIGKREKEYKIKQQKTKPITIKRY